LLINLLWIGASIGLLSKTKSPLIACFIRDTNKSKAVSLLFISEKAKTVILERITPKKSDIGEKNLNVINKIIKTIGSILKKLT